MSKIDLQSVTTLTNETSFLSTTNENSATIETASDNFLSLDGTSPNSMEANLDMNSYRIINLPEPVLSNDPVRLQDMVTYSGGGTIAAFPTTSSGLASAITDETGTGALVFGTSPTLASPTVTGTVAGAATYSTPILTSATVTTKISPTTDDGAPLGDTTHQFSDLFLASGAVVNFNAGDVTLTHSANTLAHAGASSGYTFDAVVKPSANDAAALGASGTAFSDLFLASGGVIDFNAGDVTVTHASNSLALAGAASGYTFDNPFGYAVGAGGSVTQATSKATTVVLNKPNGEIVMNGAALAAATAVSFTFTNSTVGAQDLIFINHATTGSVGSYTTVGWCQAGQANIAVRNNTAGSLSEAIVLRYTIIKGSVT